MWQRFTERARKAIFYAQQAAQTYGEGYVSTEHILLGLLPETDSIAARALERLGVSLERIRSEVEKQLPRGDATPRPDMTLTPRAKRVIDLAYDEARNLTNDYIGTEHLLLGLIREGDGLAGRVLANLGVEIGPARNAVMDVQDSGAKEAGTKRPRAEAPRYSPRSHGIRFNPAPYFLIRQGSYIAEHLFLMLVATPASDSGRVALEALDDVRRLQQEVENFLLSPGPDADLKSSTEVFQRILDRAGEEARLLGHERLLLRHLLLAVAHEDDSFVGPDLQDTLEKMREVAKRLPE